MSTVHKLGKHAPRFDARVPSLEKHLTKAALPTPPAKKDWPKVAGIGTSAWGMMLNNQLGDCVAAEKGHDVLLWTALTGEHHEVVLPDSAVLAFYETQGYIPGQPQTDNGMDMLTAAQTFQTVGIGGHRISAFATLAAGEAMSVQHWQEAINLFGAVAMGIQLPLAWQGLENEGNVWDVDPKGSLTGDWAPGSWGGHDVPIMGYDSVAKVYEFVTWGQIQYITEAAIKAYADEAYAYLSPDWFYNGKAPNLFSLAQLQADLQLESAKALPHINWSGLKTWIQALLVKLGPAAVPLIEQFVNTLSLNPAEVAAINALIQAVLGGTAKAPAIRCR
jgi:hypothetical protein